MSRKTRGLSLVIPAAIAVIAILLMLDMIAPREAGNTIDRPTPAPEASTQVLAQAVPTAEPVLLKVVDHYNIVQFGDKFYAVPHGVPVDWHKDDLTAIPGIGVASNPKAVENSIRDRERER